MRNNIGVYILKEMNHERTGLYRIQGFQHG